MGPEILRRDFPERAIHPIDVLKGFRAIPRRSRARTGRRIFLRRHRVSSYAMGMDSTGEVKMNKDLDVSIEGPIRPCLEDSWTRV